MADLLRETALDESQREIVETLSTSGQLALAQIDDVLDAAKIEAGRVEIESKPFDLEKFLVATVKVIAPQARYKGLTTETDVDEAARRWFVGDPHHLRQVLLNLLANAVKFTQRGSVKLRAFVKEAANDVALIRIEVEDTGIGIPANKQATIFEPFTQADDSITRVYGGTGLGTTIARQLVSLMGGTIGVVSAEGTGSIFWIELPMPLAEERGFDLTEELAVATRVVPSPAVAAGYAQSATVHKLRGARVLVADDNPTNQRVSQLILQSGGHAATIVNNGEEALDALERGGFDIAILDLSMPIISGLEVLRTYLFTDPNPIPVLILSANVTEEVVRQCHEAGAAEFVAKPVRASVLLNAIDRHVIGEGQRAGTQFPPKSGNRPTLALHDTQVLDLDVLAELGMLSRDPSFIERLMDGFRSDCTRLQIEITEALMKRQYEALKDAAHALKGGAGSVGAILLHQFATMLEVSARETIDAKAPALAEELRHLVTRTLRALDMHLMERRQQHSSS
jgi:two-component system sensor histidine kinase RpfC